MKKKKQHYNRDIMRITYVFAGLFFILMGYFVYFQVFESQDVINNPYNKRQDSFAESVVRGKIYSSDMQVLAETLVDDKGNETRSYPFGNLFAHIVGISTKGKTGVESLANFNLLTSNADIVERVVNEFEDNKNIGDNVVTTLDVKLQQAAYEALGENDGAVVVLEPTTGKILAMVSKPDYDPNEINSIWDSLVSNEDGTESALLNRATQGLYPPGSTFKMLTLLEYIRENPSYGDYTFDCDGYFESGDSKIRCYNNTAHGNEDLTLSFAKSCNSSFANIGLQLDLNKFGDLAESLLFNSKLPVSLPYNKSSFSLNSSSSTFDIMQTVVGQGKTQITPIHAALIASAIANNGVLMTPYVIDHVESYEGTIVKNYSPVKYGKLMSEDEAATLTEFMKAVVAEGTGVKLQSDLYDAAGKTGTAEIDSGDYAHSWFVGFAKNDTKSIAIAVVMEKMPPGSTPAVPATKLIFDTYFQE